MMWMICLFGGLGAMARYVLDVSIQRGWNRENRRTNRNFPLSTLVINGVASLCAGIAMMSYYSQSVDMDTVMMFVVGFLGVGKGYRRLLEKEFQPYECTASAL